VPRVLIGIVTGAMHGFFERNKASKMLSYCLSAVLGGLTSTFLVLGGIYVFFGRDYAAAIGTPHEMLLGLIGMTVLTNGVPEAIVGGVTGLAVCAPLKRLFRRG
jgi:uncharacterized membrane protein